MSFSQKLGIVLEEGPAAMSQQTDLSILFDVATDLLDKLADVADTMSQLEEKMQLPEGFIDAVHRLARVASTEQALSEMSIGQLVLNLISPGEVTDASTLRERMLAIGRDAKPSAITVALHRAHRSGRLVRTDVGRYRLPQTGLTPVAGVLRPTTDTPSLGVPEAKGGGHEPLGQDRTVAAM